MRQGEEVRPGGIKFLAWFTDNWIFKNFILACIILNAITLGIEANFGDANPWHKQLQGLDSIFLAIFTAELILEFLAQGFSRYVRDGWNIYDCIVVGISYLSLTAFSALRTLRVLRVLRLFSNIPTLRRVAEALIGAAPGILASIMVMGVVFYVGAVMATIFFKGTHPETFGSLADSALTLFQLAQFDSWGDTVRDLDKAHPWAWVFLLIFTIIASFAVLNLFIGVIVDAIQETRVLRDAAKRVEAEVTEIEKTDKVIAVTQAQQAEVQRAMLEEIRALRAEVQALRTPAAPPSTAA